MTTKLEINIRSLISHCEKMATENNKDWRLKKYIKSLDTMIKELSEEYEYSNPNQKILNEYYERNDELKKKTNYIESPPTQKRLKSKLKDLDVGTGDHLIKEINQIHKSKYHNDLRTELLGNEEVGVRKRGTVNTGDDMGETVKYYGDLQERIAEDMLALTKNLKEQTETANKIIKKDTEVVSKSNLLSDKNLSSLNSEADKLQDHSKRAWKCWLWLMIGVVMMIFLFMVLFMKIMKKKSS